ncbi:hypothetical protein BB561_006548 [Smittium simulii]|uniref:3-oxoacyl-[acyl-carrier-protein] reductase n=1 Tax=Smittium simulii TaxID=133385 RepID=A0A2T9Y386_9FUNG|nr:hypothetical protein BB561_006548 [Smittium simulii]
MLGQTVVVMGASGGIGEAVCLSFAKMGANVVACGRRNPILETLLEKLNSQKIETSSPPTSLDSNVSTLAPKLKSKYAAEIPCAILHKQHHNIHICDVSNYNSITTLLSYLQKHSSSVSHLINAFGITSDSILLKQPLADIQRVLDTNLLGTINSCKAFSRIFLKQRYGNIVNISSVVGQHGNRGQAVYAASKAGVIGFSKALAKEMGPANVRVNVICPGFIQTDMTKNIFNPETQQSSLEYNDILNSIILKRFGEPQDVADGVLFLSKSKYITGSVLNIDGGLFI